MRIDFDQFLAVDMRVGRVTAVDDFPEARKPAWKLTIDFGAEIGKQLGRPRPRQHSAEVQDPNPGERFGHAVRRLRNLGRTSAMIACGRSAHASPFTTPYATIRYPVSVGSNRR